MARKLNIDNSLQDRKTVHQSITKNTKYSSPPYLRFVELPKAGSVGFRTFYSTTSIAMWDNDSALQSATFHIRERCQLRDVNDRGVTKAGIT